MPTLYVREVPETIYQEARRIANQQGQSLSGYVVTVLEQAVAEEKLHSLRSQALDRIRRRRRPLPQNAPDSVTLIRSLRSEQSEHE